MTSSFTTTKKLYTPTQISLATVLGGALVATIMLWENFKALDDAKNARRILTLGLLISVLIVTFLMLLPEGIVSRLSSSFIVPILCALTAQHIAKTEQLSKEQIAAHESYTFQGPGRVLLVTVVGSVAMVGLAFGLALVLPISF